MKAFKKCRKGITLVEVIISIALIAILLIPIGNAFLTTARKNKKAEIKQQATLQAQKILDKFSSYETLEVINNPVTGKNDMKLSNGVTLSAKGSSDREWEGSTEEEEKYKIFYTLEKSDKVEQDDSVDSRTDIEKYATVIKFNKDNMEYGFVDGNKFSFNSIPYTDVKKNIQIHLLKNGSSIKEVDIVNIEGNVCLKKIGIGQINDNKKKIKIIQTNEYNVNATEILNVNFTSENKDFVVDYIIENNNVVKNDLNVNLGTEYNGKLVDAPILSPIYKGFADEKELRIGDLYVLKVTVKSTGKLNALKFSRPEDKDKDKDIILFEGESTSNIVPN